MIVSYTEIRWLMEHASLTLAGYATEQASRAKFVALMLHSFGSSADEVFPSVRAIAVRCEMSTQTIRRHLGALEAAGWIERLERFSGGSQRANGYRFLPAGIQACIPDEIAAELMSRFGPLAEAAQRAGLGRERSGAEAVEAARSSGGRGPRSDRGGVSLVRGGVSLVRGGGCR